MRKLLLINILTLSYLTSVNASEVRFSFSSLQDPATRSAYSEPDSVEMLLPEVEVIDKPASKAITSSAPVYQLDAKAIEQLAVTDISDAMRRLPGVTLRDYGGLGGLKTISVRGLGSEHTAVMYDGVPLSDIKSGQVDLSRYSLSYLNSIDLHSGDNDDIFIPARAVAGANTLSLSSFNNRVKAADATDVTVKMMAGSFGFLNPSARIERSWKEGFKLIATGDYIHSDNDFPFDLKNGSVTTREKRTHSNINSWNASLDAIYQRNRTRLNAKLYYFDSSRNLPGPVIYYVSDSNESLKERNAFGQLSLRKMFSSVFSLMAHAKFDWASTRYADVKAIYPGGRLDNRYIQREATAAATLLATPIEKWSASYSADWAFQNLSGNKVDLSRPSRNSLLQSLAVKYRSDLISVTGRLLWSLYHNSVKNGEAAKNENRLSPSLNVSVKPFGSQNLFLRGSYKNIFRLPTFSELYFDHYGTINLNPEITDQLNVGATYEKTSWGSLAELSLTADAYFNQVKNKIVAVPYNMFIWTMTNLGKVKVYGLDFTLSATFNINQKNKLLLNGSYSYQRARPRTSPESSDWNKQVAYVPWNSGAGSISWLNPWVNVVLHSTATGKRYTISSNLPDTKIDGFIDTGLSLYRSFAVKRSEFEVRFDVLNLFDTQYELVARYPMPGRSWRVSLEYHLK